MTAAHSLGVLVILLLLVLLLGCGSYDVDLGRFESGGGRYSAQLTVNRGSAVVGGDWYFVTVGKTHPSWWETLTRKQRVQVCSVQGPGNLALSWVGTESLRSPVRSAPKVLSLPNYSNGTESLSNISSDK